MKLSVLAARSRLGWSNTRRLSLSRLLLPTAKPLVPREHRDPPPPLPEPKHIEVDGRCRIEYVDVAPRATAERPMTMVMVHGAPGRYQDFRHLIPQLQQTHPHARLLALTLPGFGESRVYERSERYYHHISALPSAELTLKALSELCRPDDPLNRNVFVIGHSFGGHTALNIAALNMKKVASGQVDAIDIKGIALLASAGCQPHRVLRPQANAALVRVLQAQLPLLAQVLPRIVKVFYTKLLQFADHGPPEHYIAGIVRAGTTDFDIVREHAEMLRFKELPALMAWSHSDEYMEREIPEELARIGPPGPRLAFLGGGHNIQKTRAEELAAALRQWTEDIIVVERNNEECLAGTIRSGNVQVLP